MKKILFLHSSSELYGSDRSLLNLIKNLDKNIFSVVVILPEEGPLVNELKKIKGVEIAIYEIATLRRKYLTIKGVLQYLIKIIRSLLFLLKIIKRKDIDIVYTNTSVIFPGGIAAKILNKKSVWHIREIIDSKLERIVVSRIVNFFSDIIIANSKATGQSITNSNKKLRIIYNAIEDQGNLLETSVSNNDNNRTNIVIGMAGRINRWKGQKFFVDMAEKVLSVKANVNFVIAGDVYKGEEFLKEDLVNYILEKGLNKKIKLLGQVKEMDTFYSSIDVFILPSIKPEPFGLVVLEAMERGIPVIATNHGGPVEIIEDKKDGFLVDFQDSWEMSKIVIQLIENPLFRNVIGSKGKEKRHQVFNMNNYVKGISNILTNL